MKVAVVGSRNLTVFNLHKYLPDDTTEIVSAGAKGVGQSAREYAEKNGLALTELHPDYKRYGRSAPLKLNAEIVEYSDYVVAFWNGFSAEIQSIANRCERMKKKIDIHTLNARNNDILIKAERH